MVKGPGKWWDLGSVNELTAVKWSPDDRELLLGTYRGVVLRFDPVKGEILQKTQVFNSATVKDVAYIAYGERFKDQYAASSGSKFCAWTVKPGPGSYPTTNPGFPDHSISPDGKSRIVLPDRGFYLNDFGGPVHRVPRIEPFGPAATDAARRILEFVTTCEVSECDESKFHNRYVGKVFIPVKRWDILAGHALVTGPGAQDSDEIYCDKSGKLLRDTFRLVFTSNRWWQSDPTNQSVIVAPRGDLYVSQLQHVDWSSRTVPVRTLQSVERPGNYDWINGEMFGVSSGYSKMTWSPNGQFIAGVIAGHVIGVWRASDGSFVRPIGDNSVIYRDGKQYMFPGNRAVRWSPDGRYLASATRGRVLVWEVATGRLVEEFVSNSAQPYSHRWGTAQALHQDGAFEWSHDGKRLVFVSLFGDVEIYDF